MSEKWETVTKTKPAASKGKANGTKVSKKQEPKIYTMEDVLPASSVENMYQAAFNPTPASPKKDKKETNGTAKPKAKSTEKKVEKPKIPSTLAQAVKENLRVEDLKNLLESSQVRFPDSPLLWLRDVAAYLNLKLVTQPPTEGDILGGEPSTALTANMKKVINVMLQKSSDSMKETFFETCVANTAHDLSKGMCVTGWRILTQLLAETNPTLVTAHIPRYIELRNSYQNRPVVGLSILWSTGQAGNKSLHSGIKVWLEIMLPVITMKHYTKYVVDYLAGLLAAHNITKNTVLNKPVMDIPNFLTVQDTVFIVSTQVNNKECAKSLKDLYPGLRAIAVAGCKNHELFPELLERLGNLSMPDQVVDTLDLLATCLMATPAALVHWHKAYTSHLPQSGQLLQYLDTNWARVKPALDVPEFHETIEAFEDYNQSVINKEGLALASQGCTSLAGKMSTPGMPWFPWKTLSFLLLISTAAIINLDCQKHGNFSKSSTGQFLRDIGQYDRVLTGYQVVVDRSKEGKQWVDINVPVYAENARRVGGPYYEVAQTKAGEAQALMILGYGKLELAVKAGVVKIEGWVPGAQEQINKVGQAVVKGGQVMWLRTQQGALTLQQGAVDLVNGDVDWVAVKANAVARAQIVQGQLVAAFNYVQGQVNQLVK
eukprot:TRINITY_DN67042_c0_g1_i1.p1 TRINITY_DN67042_c0_g1~~TRINITY_DN67042_c0_g1_i1.p1  ORF type:complete len:657 (-),score=239.38 TRINITY_DN67042_c0_g1_i1:96-2066(-)